MASDTISLANGGIACTFTLPATFKVAETLAPHLAYPVELGGIMNVELPINDDPEGDMPRIDLLPPRGVVLWLVAGDQNYDKGATQLPKGGPATGAVPIKGLSALDRAEEYESRWEATRFWERVVPLPASKYCYIFGFSGKSSFAPIGALSGVVQSLEFRA